MVRYFPALLAFAATVIVGTSAHPGHDVEQEIAERSAFFQGGRRDLSHCAARLKQRGIEKRAIQRRSAAVRSLRRDVALKSRCSPSNCPAESADTRCYRETGTQSQATDALRVHVW